jgi:hypothetical protein
MEVSNLLKKGTTYEVHVLFTPKVDIDEAKVDTVIADALYNANAPVDDIEEYIALPDEE